MIALNIKMVCSRGHDLSKVNTRSGKAMSDGTKSRICAICAEIREKRYRLKAKKKYTPFTILDHITENDINRIKAKSIVGDLDDCWVYTGSGTRTAPFYGTTKVKGIMCLVHRVMAHVLKGPIEEGMQVLHRCDNPPCWNPKHLFYGTQADNIQDCASKGRHPSQIYPGIRKKKH